MITAEVAIYPLKTNDATGVINSSIDILKGTGLSYEVTPMNTRLTGSKEEIFGSLEDMFAKAENTGGEINMVITLSNAG